MPAEKTRRLCLTHRAGAKTLEPPPEHEECRADSRCRSSNRRSHEVEQFTSWRSVDADAAHLHRRARLISRTVLARSVSRMRHREAFVQDNFRFRAETSCAGSTATARMAKTRLRPARQRLRRDRGRAARKPDLPPLVRHDPRPPTGARSTSLADSSTAFWPWKTKPLRVQAERAVRPATEFAVAWDDADLGIEWPLERAAPILSARDAATRPLERFVRNKRARPR